ncbi:MAG: metallophosphoesterase [Lentisphaeria bacterium]|nr:metallophosphoesterase [Lentisphaeria bacterium]
MTPNGAQTMMRHIAGEAVSEAPVARRMVLIADSHVKMGTLGAERFFEMLRWLENTSYDVVFLGDIMELWIGVPSYEDDTQKSFLEWCRREKEHRRIYFLEGNHEFFVLAHHRDCFSEASSDELRIGDVMFAHGDSQIAEASHRRFRWWSKSPLAHFLLRWLPFASSIVRRIKADMERRSLARTHRFPGSELALWCKREFALPNAAQSILVGHFHREFTIRRKDGRLFAVLPAWKDSEEIAVFDPLNNFLDFRIWRSVK